MKKSKLSVVLATYNEESNIARCLDSVADLADELIVVDGGSTDRTVELAGQRGARVIRTDNPPIFHINKQKALDAATCEWVLQMDADEVVTPQLADEIRQIVHGGQEAIDNRIINEKKLRLFNRHTRLVEDRDGSFGVRTGETVAFFVPRKTYFLGDVITHAGTYPDGVIRLVKNGKARFPAKSVHEQIQIDGAVGWLEHDLIHYSNPTMQRYVTGADKYTSLLASELQSRADARGVVGCVRYTIFIPVMTFLSLYIRHKGFLDGWRGLLFSLFSALHFPVAYIKKELRASSLEFRKEHDGKSRISKLESRNSKQT